MRALLFDYDCTATLAEARQQPGFIATLLAHDAPASGYSPHAYTALISSKNQKSKVRKYWYTFMMEVSDGEFEKYLAGAIDAIPKPYSDRLQNVAFIVEDEPTPGQRSRLNLYTNETLFGLYEGVPLPRRGGNLKILPDKITIFKIPLLAASPNQQALMQNIGRTVWHEVAHYYGLDHKRIHELEKISRI